MNCKDFEKHIAGYIQGSLSDELRHELEAHKDGCPACARQISLNRLLASSLNRAERVKAPDGFAERMLQAIAQEQSNVVAFDPIYGKQAAQPAVTALDCKTFENNAAAFVDGVLEAGFATRMETHRETCLECARLTTVHRMIAHALNTTEPVLSPVHVKEHILENIAAERAEKNRVFSLTRIGLYGTASAAAGLIAAAFTSLTGNANLQLPKESILASALNLVEGSLISMYARVFGWIVSVLPAEMLSEMSKIAAPVQIPFVNSAIPPYYFLLMGAISIYFLLYFKSPDPFSVKT